MEAAHLSPRQFSRAFRVETGQSPATAIEQLRVEAARLMMDETRHPIDAVADEVGFADGEGCVAPSSVPLASHLRQSGGTPVPQLHRRPQRPDFMRAADGSDVKPGMVTPLTGLGLTGAFRAPAGLDADCCKADPRPLNPHLSVDWPH